MKKFLALLLCVQLVLCTGVGLAQAAPAAQQADVVIVGAGAAGMTAAISAYETGARNILLVEKTVRGRQRHHLRLRRHARLQHAGDAEVGL